MSYDRHDRAMDRYITGNWGEDQLRGECECETPADGLIQHKWTCPNCGTIWEVVGMYDDATPEWESIGQVEEEGE
jgi:hypothetical protein